MANNGSGEVLEHLLPVLKVPASIPSADLRYFGFLLEAERYTDLTSSCLWVPIWKGGSMEERMTQA